MLIERRTHPGTRALRLQPDCDHSRATSDAAGALAALTQGALGHSAAAPATARDSAAGTVAMRSAVAHSDVRRRAAQATAIHADTQAAIARADFGRSAAADVAATHVVAQIDPVYTAARRGAGRHVDAARIHLDTACLADLGVVDERDGIGTPDVQQRLTPVSPFRACGAGRYGALDETDRCRRGQIERPATRIAHEPIRHEHESHRRCRRC
jgi:hypothetical protein